MRCAALAELARRENHEPIFAGVGYDGETLRALEVRGLRAMDIHAKPGSEDDLAQALGIYCREHCDWVVLDNYYYGPEYQNSLKRAGAFVLIVDDESHQSSYEADLLLNQNVYATEQMYSAVPESCELLLGTRYVLLRDEFRKPCARSYVGSARYGLITAGGGDDRGLIEMTLAGSRSLDSEIIWTVVVGARNPRLAEHRMRAKENVSVLVGAENMSELMARSDFAVAAGGTTVWEMASQALPMILVAIARNQLGNVRSMSDRGAAISAGRIEDCDAGGLARRLQVIVSDPVLREELGTSAARLVDGQGCSRVLRKMAERIK